jgi:hypothetical protein
MHDDELKNLWKRQPLRDPALSPAQLVSAMEKQMSQFRRTLVARDVCELVACAVVIVVFGIFYFTLSRTPMSRLGDLLVIASSLWIAGKLVHARRSNPPAPPGATAVESLRAELNAVRAQSRLLGSILWWYLLPLAIGIFVCTWGHLGGGVGGLVGLIIYSIFVIALYAFIYRLNQSARANQLLPVEAQLKSLLHSAETGEPMDETQVAKLRPIVLSMAAADKIKPVEFKVAFWQLALWGEVGFVGIWFFLMLGLTLDKPHWKSQGQLLETLAPGVRLEEANRYSVVARNVSKLLNEGDYAAVQELYNPEMRKAFPPNETSDFYLRLAAFGRIDKVDGPTGDGFRGWTAFRLHCQRGELMMSLALDADDKISGIHFQRAPRPFTENNPLVLGQSFVLQLFSWQHLLWLVPFILAGLFYSWLLQKTTQRAVGISALGIHLQRGLNLVLWDELMEVRPLRILNIRSLWLIRESGKKTIMPWTSLERPSELKAAVENFAPPQHPLRKYLSLLK